MGTKGNQGIRSKNLVHPSVRTGKGSMSTRPAGTNMLGNMQGDHVTNRGGSTGYKGERPRATSSPSSLATRSLLMSARADPVQVAHSTANLASKVVTGNRPAAIHGRQGAASSTTSKTEIDNGRDQIQHQSSCWRHTGSADCFQAA